jgi:hypothetical protein
MYRALITAVVMTLVGGFAWTMGQVGTPSVYGQVASHRRDHHANPDSHGYGNSNGHCHGEPDRYRHP